MYFIFYWAEFWHSLLRARVTFFFFPFNDLFVKKGNKFQIITFVGVHKWKYYSNKETDIFTMDNTNLEFYDHNIPVD